MRSQLLGHPIGAFRHQLPDRPRFNLVDDLHDPGGRQSDLRGYAPQRVSFNLVENINRYVPFTWRFWTALLFVAHNG